MFQGYFTHYLDKSPVSVTSWYDPTHSYLINHTSYVYADGVYIKTKQKRKLNYNHKQPELSKHKNCTAAITDHHQLSYPWVTIACEEMHDAAYICQRSQPLSTVKGTILKNRTCDENWITLEGSENCLFLVPDVKRKISFHESEKMCLLKNASLFKVDISDEIDSTWDEKELQIHFNYGLDTLFADNIDMIEIHQVSTNRDIVGLQSIVFGRHVAEDSLQNIYLRMIWWAGTERQNYMTYFTYFNESCAIVSFSMTSYYYDLTNHPLRGWGIKCRPCDEAINVSGVICEKTSLANNINCTKNQFKCQDNTCILSIYQCDFTLDCNDGSDEENCDPSASRRAADQFITLPCRASGVCEAQILVQSICDGINITNDSMPHENEICAKPAYGAIKPTIKIHTKQQLAQVEFGSADIVNVYFREKNYTCDNSHNITDTVIVENNSLTNSSENSTFRECADIRDLCQVGVNNIRCHSYNLAETCGPLACPGMFKCQESYCVLISYVCDNVYDCRHGEDEHSCSTSSCPGFLKCRGERRCVGVNQICDSHVDCWHSMDDELECDTCPDNCKCNGYVMSCFSENSLQMIYNRDILYMKYLRVEGMQNSIVTKQLHATGLLFLNMSSTELNKINVSEDNSYILVYILFVDFSQNKLNTVHFLRSNTFKNVIFVDLSFNFIHTVIYGKRLILRHLTWLLLMGNPLQEINVIPNSNSKLALIDLKLINHFLELTVVLFPNMYVELQVEVSDSLLCCMFHQEVNCLSSESKVKCYGLIETHVSQICFACLSFISLFMSLGIFLRQTISMIEKKTTPKRTKQYLILCMCQIVSHILIVLYLVAIWVADTIKVNLLLFRHSFICLILNAILYISLVTLIAFRTCILGFVALKIVYPFKHQCTWLKRTALITVIIWVFVTLTYISSILFMFFTQMKYNFDNVCSIGWCVVNDGVNVLHLILLFVFKSSLILHIIAVFKVYIFLENHQKIVPASNKHYSANIVTCKLTASNLSEIILMIYLFIFFTLRLSNNLSNDMYCFNLFLYSLPMYTCLSGIINIFK